MISLELASLCHTCKPERIRYEHKQKSHCALLCGFFGANKCQLFRHRPLHMAVDVSVIHENSLAYTLAVETTVLLSEKNMIQNMINTQMIRVSAE